MSRTEQPIHWQQVSRALFEADPMHTACKENDCFDEYDLVARDVVAQIEKDAALGAAMEAALGEWFGAELAADRDLSPVVEQLNTQTREGGGQ